MPELPELEVVREVLERRLVGRRVERIEVIPPGGPIVVRELAAGDPSSGVAALAGQQVAGVERIGKFLVLALASSRAATTASHVAKSSSEPAAVPAPVAKSSSELAAAPVATASPDAPTSASHVAINAKLTGRLQLARRGERRRAATWVAMRLDDGTELRYVDAKKMGQVYVARARSDVPGLVTGVPDALAVTLDRFRARIGAFRGEIKGILTRGELVAGIGNAYADEILWAARLHPFRKRTTLSADDVDRLHAAIGTTLRDAIAKVREQMGERIDEKPRAFLAVHGKSGEPCPRCGAPVSLNGANQTITNFCRACQPGGLIRGM